LRSIRISAGEAAGLVVETAGTSGGHRSLEKPNKSEVKQRTERASGQKGSTDVDGPETSLHQNQNALTIV